ncbi:MAG: HAMP domain-containing histidine kinase, partial [Betaproteobacteria bacterium]|nr:HAMP domain-containing histidine kinase [Betaproteobacteria bacterium]
AIGTIYGIWLSVVPVRRIREIQRISHKIVNGDIGLRLPVSNRNDELDMLAGIVNLMLDEIEQRMLDIKGASDSVAHNLRTPLTRLRATLNRLEDICQEGEERTCVGQAIDEVDHLLSRFRALLRISEISGSMRKAGFETVDLKSVLQKVQEVYAPLAEEKSIAFDLLLPPDPVEILGDSALLFEAILNLVDNAIKFTPPSGVVQIILEPRPVVKVVDSGPGIRQEHIKRVMQPFYRGDTSRNVPGSGVGLSIVSAIANLHGFRFDLVSGPSGTQAFLYCIHS